MAREFEVRKEVELDASPEQVWEAIATRQGLTAWLWPMDIEPDGADVTAWDPPNHLAIRTPEAEDGSTQAFEYLIEAREGGSTVLRFVHSGFLSDNWDTEYEDMTSAGWDMYLNTLAQYLKHFPGRTATYVEAEGPRSSATEDAWPVVLEGLRLTDAVQEGDKVRLAPDGFAPIEGVVDYVGPTFLGVRTNEGLYRFHGRAKLGMSVATGHYIYSGDVDPEKTQNVWQSWLNRLFA